ncbi:hypothetical protein GCM10010987_20340 [Bradyrhizobium guangdongense]|uniref:Uncharacterized protein n=2 Tax=Bradyrhizobium guangdongense TaxID=1325090 RepID=A0A410VGV6_9BRAD|nr:hypothetical protein X265_23960 [Bradyrhizobium guangdongense]QOZ63934.1 hypothetical protein XH86_23980 [Bradyrhizobium guangdongense]GGI22626.1 hypothetical protein GCM10010987_20340 [Bradyrhizobium guangdongense]
MRTASRSFAEKFHGVVDYMVAALHQQRAIEARRVLQRYHHLLHAPSESSPLNECISVRNEEEFSANAHKSAARERSAPRPSLERA